VVITGIDAIADTIFKTTGYDIRTAMPNPTTTLDAGNVGGVSAQGQQAQTINNNSTVDVTIKVEVRMECQLKEVSEALRTQEFNNNL